MIDELGELVARRDPSPYSRSEARVRPLLLPYRGALHDELAAGARADRRQTLEAPLMSDTKKPGRKLIPASTDLDEAELAAIKAIRSYELVEKRILLFEEEHAEVFKTYDEQLEELERKRQVADAAIRGTDASFGPWQRFSEQRTYDTTALYSLVGEERFLDLGGTVTQMPVYDLEKDKLEVAIAAKKISKSIIDAILKITPKYRAPKPRIRQ